MSNRIYADNSATTRLSPAALDAMLPFLREDYGNASAVYEEGRCAKRALELAREKAAEAIGAKPRELYFTGGGSEADNWALRAVAEARKDRGRHIIVSAIEHHAIIHTAEALGKQGFDISLLPVDILGRVSPDALRAALRDDTILVSVMTANNEVGTIEPIAELAAIAHERGVLFHTDAVQAVGHIPLDVRELDVDLLSLAAHKFHGPKGVGALYIKSGLKLPSLISGGAQENGLRAGTENVAGIVGMSAALCEAVAGLGESVPRLSALRDRLIEGALKLPGSRLTGDPQNRLPGHASFIFDCVEGEALVLRLDRAGVCASSGSACSSGSLDPSHVLTAIGLKHEQAHGSLRLSLGEYNSDADVDGILAVLPEILEKLRKMSPLWDAGKEA